MAAVGAAGAADAGHNWVGAEAVLAVLVCMGEVQVVAVVKAEATLVVAWWEVVAAPEQMASAEAEVGIHSSPDKKNIHMLSPIG